MKNKDKLIIVLFIILVLLFVVFFWAHHCYGVKNFASKSQNITADIYVCPMHPGFTSDKPGDCIICGMKLVKKEKLTQPSVLEQPIIFSKSVAPAQEKTLAEVCVEHNCTMKNCAMHVRTNIKPGERIICPVCGEVISTANGKVVEIVKQPVKADAAVSKKERKILYYRNPMNPEVTSPSPMKDSMGMDYVAVYEEAVPTVKEVGVYPVREPQKTQMNFSNGVNISPEKQQLIGVKTEAVKKMPLTKVVRAFGKIAYDPNLYVAQEEYIQALKTANATKNSVLASITEQSNAFLAASEKKLLLLGMSKSEIEQLAKDGLAQESLYLPAGQNTVWIYVSVYEYEVGLVKIGQVVEIEATAYPGEVFKGNVVSINPVLDAESRTNQVRVEVENPEGKLKPQMFTNAKIQVSLGEKLAVPKAAVLDTGLRKIVYLSKEGDMLESREVALGQEAEGYYEVLDGLNEGDIVVTSGNFLVDSESRLKSVLSGQSHNHGQ